MFITENETNQVLRAAAVHTARKLKIQYPELKESIELHDEIKQKDINLFDIMNEFCLNYFTWFKFHLDRIEKSNYNENEINELEILIQKRDASRKKLINELEK